MPVDQVHTAVQDFLTTHWASTAVAYENDGFQPQVDTDGTIEPWLLVEVYGGLYEQASIGAGTAQADLWTDTGVVWLHIFVGSGTGSLVAKQYAAALAELFRGLELDTNIRFGDISIGSGGGTSNGNDWTLSTSVDWVQA